MRAAHLCLIALLLGAAPGLTPCLAAAEAASNSQLVRFQGKARPGTIVVRTAERRLYLVLDRGVALRYPVGVGRPQEQWTGASSIVGKFIRPNWAPPARIRRDRPNLPAVIASGSPANPMGAAALTLAGNSYAIHGTNKPGSIGGFVSYGCIRMHNEDILDLFGRVQVGTRVLVIP